MSCDAFRIDRILAACSSVDPCEKFNLATAIPASMSRLMVGMDDVAGPIVQTIFVFVFSELILLYPKEMVESLIKSTITHMTYGILEGARQ
jgi:hypothetical protein